MIARHRTEPHFDRLRFTRRRVHTHLRVGTSLTDLIAPASQTETAAIMTEPADDHAAVPTAVDREAIIAAFPPPSDLATRLSITVGRINRLIRPVDPLLSYGQLSALATVARLGPIRPVDLARAEQISPPSMTRLVAFLEQNGYVVRQPDPDDGRAFYAAITSAGVDALRAARAERAEHVAELLQGRTDAELETVAAALDILDEAGLHAR